MDVRRQTSQPAARVLTAVDRILRDMLDSPRGNDDSLAGAPALVRHIVLTIMRRRATLDWLIDSARRGRVRPRLRRGLWWALTQALFLDGLPPAVAVDTLVGFLRRKSPTEARLANALCRTLLAPGREAVLRSVREQAPPWVVLDLGEALYSRWEKRLSAETLASLAAVLREPAPLVFRVRSGYPAPEGEGIEPLPDPDWAPEARLFRCDDPGAFFSSEAWRRGEYYVQDPATLLAPAFMEARPGECVADLCCAPGGKTLILAEAVGEGGTVIGMDRSPRRLRRFRENISREKSCRVLAGDACFPPFASESFDAVLLDVPCSNTGVLRRKPDVRWHFHARKVRELAELQALILRRSARLVRPGGRLVYSTCSLEPEENTLLVERFLAEQADFRLTRERQVLPAVLHDGAYAAQLIRG